ncbi:MAG: PHP domain-containing protein, partial [Roseibium sp.]|uniref:PHP domain-containing protein n=1 Tax=Roseibium sp. TaxID=1936156 RepID=UPI0026306901
MTSHVMPDSLHWDIPRYAELCVTSNFTFLRGASHPEELVTRAASLGLEAIAVTDWNSLAGVVRAYSALKEIRRTTEESIQIRSHTTVDPSSRQATSTASPLSVESQTPQDRSSQVLNAPETLKLPRLIVGARLVLEDSPLDWVALPTDRAAYERLSQLLTLGKRRAEKGDCHLEFSDLMNFCAGLVFIALPQFDHAKTEFCETAKDQIRTLRQEVPGHVFLGAAPRYDGTDQAWFRTCAKAAHSLATPMVAVGDVLMHRADRRRVADVLTCLREGCTIDEIGTKALLNGERRLKSAGDMARLYRHHPAALRRSVEIATRCSFDLSELSYEYPDEISDGENPQDRLERLTWQGLENRYPGGVPDYASTLAEKELRLIAKLKF